MILEEPPPPQDRVRLQFLESPLVNKDRDSTDGLKQPRFQNDTSVIEYDRPVLERHDEPNLLEVFFDLFFAANYAIFTKNQSIYSMEQLASHVSYFSILWVTWLVTAFYDVRYATDSIFERMAKGAHLGVLVGFAVVTPNFNPIEQNAQTMRTMSLILMVSRLALAVEYASIAWHVRKFKNAGLGLYLQIGLCVAAAVVYLGVSFRFTDGNSRIFIAWYVVVVLEVLLTFLLSTYCLVLSFTRTHLMKRLAYLTVIILGDGIVIMAEKVVVIVKAPDAWNGLTIGLVTAATSIVYFIFLLYFDWIREFYLPTWRQQLWTLLHFPFHLALVLWQTCFAQFIIWSKIFDINERLMQDEWISNMDNFVTATSAQVASELNKTVNSWTAKYPIKWAETLITLDAAMTNITEISDEFWPTLAEATRTEDYSDFNISAYEIYDHALNVTIAALDSSLFAIYEIDLMQEMKDANKLNNDTNAWLNGDEQISIDKKTGERLQIVWTYGYICIGLVLVFMTILSAITRRSSWKAWPIIRTTIFLLLSIGIGLVVLIGYNDDIGPKFVRTHMLLPLICIVIFSMLVFTHVRSDSPSEVLKRSATFLSTGRRDTEKSFEVQYTVASKYDPGEGR